MSTQQTSDTTLSITRVLVCTAAILTLSMGIRHGFGLWLQPVTQAREWGRGDYGLAIAVQNLCWGLASIFVGMAADRLGAFKVLVVATLLYALGLVAMAHADTVTLFVLSAGVMIGVAQAGSTYGVLYGVIGRNVPSERRSWAMGVAGSAGSFGQFLIVPLAGQLISALGWQDALVFLGLAALAMLPMDWALREPQFSGGATIRREQTIAQALREALAYPSFRWLMAGYFVCGFQVVFIAIHMPSYLRDHGLEPQVASYALGLIGLFNVVGTYTAGALGQRMQKRYILSAIYLARAFTIGIFLWAPLSPTSVYVFASVMGVLWLSTVPPTNSIVAQIFGVAHLSMLSGFVFFSHQIGSFMGVWLGGYLYDTTGSYDVVWYIAIALGVFAALANMPVKESAIARGPALAAAH